MHRKYLRGELLYGNDFSLEQIEEWYREETEAYANLNIQTHKRTNVQTYNRTYSYHNLNISHGFNKLPNQIFENALGFGAAWGSEFEPIINRISRITIVEPSEQMVAKNIKHIKPTYVKPTIAGNLPFENNSFDLITCFGTLHHIPNVGFILEELVRVLKPNGYLLLREPIHSMGDWRNPRKGLTKNERGIPVAFFKSIIANQPITIISESYCFTMQGVFKKIFSPFFKKSIHNYKLYVATDKMLSSLLRFNARYNPTKKTHRIAPTSVFFVFKKN